MKSEHRHELKTNDLSRIATEWGHISERYVHNHAYTLIAAVVLAIAAIVGVLIYRGSAEAVDRKGWQALMDAQKAGDYGTVADKYPGTQVGEWARLREAEGQYSSAIRLVFTDGDAGRAELKKSEESFEKLVSDKSTHPDVLERALFGLARCRESLPEKNVPPSKINDRAIDTYQRLLNPKEFPDTVYKELAEARIKALRSGSAQNFYAWFETQRPKPADRERPKDLTVPPLPQPPDFGNEVSPSPAAHANPPKGEASKSTSAQTPPANKPAATTPATKTPAANTPAGKNSAAGNPSGKSASGPNTPDKDSKGTASPTIGGPALPDSAPSKASPPPPAK